MIVLKEFRGLEIQFGKIKSQIEVKFQIPTIKRIEFYTCQGSIFVKIDIKNTVIYTFDN